MSPTTNYQFISTTRPSNIMLFKICWFVSLLALCHANIRNKRIVGGYPALIPENPYGGKPSDNADKPTTNRPPPQPVPTSSNNIVFIQDEYRNAEVVGAEEPDGTCAFKGIRYAQPPVGKLRFQRPVLVHPDGKYEAVKYGSPCPQLSIDGNGLVGSEDCLFLNVFTPSNKNEKIHPVLVWIHGGGFHSGSALQYVPSSLVKKDIIVVTVQYRLGSLGWLTSNIRELPGNVGLFDMRAAVKWVKDYISYFNGDPERIVIAGQGSGASAATLLSMSEFTKDMFSGVFALSGSPVSPFAVDPKPKTTYLNVTSLMGCKQENGLEAVKCLQMLPLKDIINSDFKYENKKLSDEGFLSGLSNVLGAGPSVEGKNDGRFLPFFLLDSPLNLLKKNLPKIPMLTGVNKQETKSGLLGKFKREVQDQLAKFPDYVTKVMPGKVLQSNSGLYKNGDVNSALKSLFENGNYLKLISSSFGGALKDFVKVIQGTTDAMFNLPAFLTSMLWSKRGSTYFYSFEYKSKCLKAPGKWFLPNILGPADSVNDCKGNTVNKNDEDSGEPGHGDELIYLYDVRSIEGKPIQGAELKDPKDIEMRDNFTSLVANFVHSGKPSLSKLDDEWPSFTSAKQSEYVILSENSRIEKKFRFCEVGLWAGVPDILQSSTCNFPGIKDILKTVPNLLNEGVLGDVKENTMNILRNPIGAVGNVLKPPQLNNLTPNIAKPNLGVPSLLGSLTGNPTNQKNGDENQKPTQRPAIPNLFGKKKK